MSDAIRFYLDENVPWAIAHGLRQRGVDVLTAPEEMTLGADDPTQLDHATQLGRVLFTQDRDFIRIAFEVEDHPGVVYASQARSIGEIIAGLITVHGVMSPEEMRGKLEIL